MPKYVVYTKKKRKESKFNRLQIEVLFLPNKNPLAVISSGQCPQFCTGDSHQEPPELFYRKSLQGSQENTCAKVSILIKIQASACKCIKKEALAQVLSCEFCDIFKNTFFLQNTFGRMLLYFHISALLHEVNRSFYKIM